jgi:putative hydrolase of the HAD superfamily
MTSPERAIDAVIFDFGGVLTANGRIGDIAKRFDHPDHEAVQRILMGDYGANGDHPWHRLERGEISLDENRRLNKAALAAAGIELRPLAPSNGSERPPMTFERNEPVISLVDELRAAGIRLGVLTNNVREFREMWRSMLPFDEWFDDVVDSHEVGMRKPDPAIYELALTRLGVHARRTAFLDDVLTNVRAAEQVGMIGVLVPVDPTPAVAEVRRLAGFST